MNTNDSFPLSKWTLAQQEVANYPLHKRLPAVTPTPLPAHVGLWLDRCLIENTRDDAKPGRQALHNGAIDALAVDPKGTSPVLEAWRGGYKRWRTRLETLPDSRRLRVLTFEATSRILLHPASGATVTDGSLLMHHTWGVPYIPGSALRGLCRGRARRMKDPAPNLGADSPLPDENQGGEVNAERQNIEPTWLRELLGWAEVDADQRGNEERPEAGLIIFHDGMWVPEAPKGRGDFSALALDIVNPHHPAYYAPTSAERPPPGETDDPKPTHLLTVAPGARFCIVVEATEDWPALGDWLDLLVDRALIPALKEDGIGARTSAGYGRLKVIEGSLGTEADEDSSSTEEPGLLTWSPGKSELKAALDSGKVAYTSQDKAKEIIQSLSEAEIKRLIKRRRAVGALIRWEPIGNSGRILSVRSPSP